MLIENDHLEPIGPFHGAGVRFQAARKDLEERAFPAAVFAEQAQLVAGTEPEVQRTEQPAAAQAFPHLHRLHQAFAPPVASGEIDVYGAGLGVAVRQLA